MKKHSWLLIAFCLTATVLLLVWGFGQGGASKQQEASLYALVIENDTGPFLMQLRKGISDAAAMAGASLTVVSRDDPLPAQAQAVLLWLDSPQAWVDAHPTQLPVYVIDGRARGCPSISMDDKAAVVALLSRAQKLAAPLAVITDDDSTRSLRRSTQAAALAGIYNCDLIAYQPGMGWPEGYQTVVALSGRATAALAAQSGNKTLLGFDTGDDRATLLENGTVAVMALDKPYALGGLAVQAAQARSADDVAVTALLADKQNMYLPENVKQVFPLLQ